MVVAVKGKTDGQLALCDFCVQPLPGGRPFRAIRAEWKVGLALPDGTLLDDNLEWKICIVCDGLIRAKKYRELLDRYIDFALRSRRIPNTPMEILMARSEAIGTWRAVLGEEFRKQLVLRRMCRRREDA